MPRGHRTSPQELAGLVKEVTPQAVELRRLLHRHPEPAFKERRTTALIAATLRENSVRHKLRTPSTADQRSDDRSRHQGRGVGVDRV
ncbi:MAG: hypothetical protein ACC658_06915, partial [Acidimicrobiia bacterium]